MGIIKNNARVTYGSLSGGPVGSKDLPWDAFSILSVNVVPPAADGLGVASACAKGVAAFTRLGVGISGIANVRNV